MNKKFLFIILILITLSWHLSLQNNDTIDAETKNTASISTSEKTPLAPALVALSHFPLQDPSNNMPLLEWREDLNAVYYELELFDTIPDDLSDEELSSEHLYYTASFIQTLNNLI